jgi:transcriptional regulator with XRE-family HTH domain
VRRFSDKTQEEAGAFMNLDRAQISRIESGSRQASIFEVLLLARFYGVPTSSLMKAMAEIQRSLDNLKSPAQLSGRSN